MRRIVAIVLLGLLLAAPAMAQGLRGIPEQAADPLREALRLLETVKSSTLDPGWRANAAARAARTLARAGDREAARARAQEAALANAEESRTPPPPGLSEGAVAALLAQTYADLQDAPTAHGIAVAAMAAIGRLGDAATRATLYAYVAQALAEIGNADPAAEAVLQGLRSASVTQPGRERLNALTQLIIAQAKLGQVEEARATLDAARESLAAVTQPADRPTALAYVARAAAAVGDKTGAQALAREAATTYVRTQAQLTELQRAVTLALLALTESEVGDRTAAQQTLRQARQAADAVQQVYDRLQAMLSLADAAVQLER
jgi:hypothetical protein